MSFVSSFDSQSTPDVSLREATPAPSIKAAAIGVIGAVGQASRGPVGVPTRVGSFTEWIRKFGDYNSSQLGEGYMYMYNLFRAGANQVDFVRVTDGNHTQATASVSGTMWRLTTPGSWGNSVTLTVTASTIAGYVNLRFANGNAEVYEYNAVTFTDSADPNYVQTIVNNAAQSDDFVEIVTLVASNPPAATYTFTGGSNGTVQGASLTDSAYTGTNSSSGLTGLVALEADEDVEIIVCARASDTVSTSLKTHVSLSTVTPRMAVCAPASGTTVSTLVTTMASFNTDRCQVTYPWVQIVNPQNNRKEYHNPTAFYAGVLAGLSYHISPSRQVVNGVIGTERALTRSDVDTLSNSRVSPITLLAGAGFVIRNGNTASNNPALRNVTRRRAVNFFGKTFEAGLQPFVSKPHTPGLQIDVVNALSNILQNEANAGKIGNVTGGRPFAVKCDSENNPLSVIQQNQMMVDIQISLWSPADFINVTLDAVEGKVLTIG